MIKVKDGYAKLIGTTYLGSASRVLLSNGGDHVLGNASGNIPLSNGTVNTNLNSDLLDGLHAGTSNGTVATYIVFPSYTTLINEGFLESDYVAKGHPDELFLKALCKWAINKYSGVDPMTSSNAATLIGYVTPNSSGTCIIHLYRNSGKDSTTLLPRYCRGLYQTLGGALFLFGTSDYVWSYWRYAYDSEIPNVTNYYWANIKISSSSNANTTPTFSKWTTSDLNLVLHTTGGRDLGMRVTGKTNSIGFIIGSSNANRGIYDYTNSNWILVKDANNNIILPSGKIGIGINNPECRLHVNDGIIKISNNDKYVTIGPGNETYTHYITDAASHWFNKLVEVNGPIYIYGTTYCFNSNGLYTKELYANRDGAKTYGGISLYSNTDPMTYGIAFRGTETYGKHGYITSDWATYLTMNNQTGRGWIFRRGSTNVFSIESSGLAYADSRISANYYVSRVATGTQPYACTSTTLNTNLNADMLDGKHSDSFIQTNNLMIKGTGGYVDGYHGETGWHRIATIDNGNYGYSSFILYLCGNWNFVPNTSAILHINTRHTTAAITLVSGIVGYTDKIRLVNISANKFYVDVHINYTDNPDKTNDTPGNVWFYFLGNGYVTVNTAVEKITAEVTASAEITLVNGGKITNANYADNATKIYVNLHTSGDVEYPLVWSNENNTSTKQSNLLYKSYSNLTYNPKNNRITAGTFRSGSSTFSYGVIELYTSVPFIDFHYNSSTADYTNRIIEGLEGLLTVTGKLRVGLPYSTSTDYNFHVAGSAYSGSLNINSTALISSNGWFYPTNTNLRTVGVYGIYDSYKVGHIWSIGTGYRISSDGSNTGNMYGLVYFHTNWSADSAYNTTKRDGALITEVSSYAESHLVALVNNGKVHASLGNYVWSRYGFKKNGSSDSYVLLGGGGHKLISDFASASSLGNYLPLTGGTLTGPLKLKSEQYNGNYALDMSNSDIVNVNAIFTRDLAENAGEGLQFSRGDNTYDSIWCKQGVFYFSPNGNADRKGTYNTNYTVIHSGNYSDFLDSRYYTETEVNNKLAAYLPLSGGTMTGKITMNAGTGLAMKYTSSGNDPWIYPHGADSYGIRYFEGNPDKMAFSATGNNTSTSTADLCINGNGDGTVTIRGKNIAHSGNLSQSGLFLSTATNSGSNVILTGYLYHVIALKSNTNNYLYHRIAYCAALTGSWVDKYALYRITMGYKGGHQGIFKVVLRTDDVSKNNPGSMQVEWLERQGFASDQILVGFNDTSGNTYLDVFYKCNGTYHSVIIEQISNVHSRGGVGRAFTLVQSLEYSNTTASDNKGSYEVYSSITSGMISGRTYTSVVMALDSNNRVGLSNATGTDNMLIYPERTNEINFGGNNSASTLYFGYRAKDKKSIPTSFVFGGNDGTATLKSSGFIKKDGTAAQLLRADGGVATFNWSGQSGQPVWLWGGNSQHTYYVYDPSNFNVNSATKAKYLISVSPETGAKFWYYMGQPTLSESYDGSSSDYSIYSYPKEGTYASSSNVNIQNLRIQWSAAYFHDIFASPNARYLWHRDVSNTSAHAWARIVEEDCSDYTRDWNISIAGKSERARYLETQKKDNTDWYGNEYKAYLKWETSSIAKLVIDGYDTKTDYSIFSNYLKVLDVRNTDHGPNSSTYPATYVTAWFNNTGTPNEDWWSGLTFRGWSDGYAAWLICSYSSTGTANNYRLYHRNGNNSTWGSWKNIAYVSDITKSQVGLENVLNTAFYKRQATVNGTTWDLAGTINSLTTFTIYAPIAVGSSGLILKSKGSGNPEWISLSEIAAGSAVKLLTSSNTINSTTDDTVAKWGPLGTSIHYYSSDGKLTDLPNTYGFVLNVTNRVTEVHLLWLTQASGNIAHRGGNASGWYGSWRVLLDTTNYTSYVYSKSDSDSRYVNASGDTMSGSLIISNGGELRLKAHSSTSTDPGDIVFQNSSGTEIGRIFKPAGTNAFQVRFSSSDAAKVLIHSGNYTDYTVTKTGTGASGTWGINISGTANKATNDVDGKAFKTTYLRKVTVANNTTNDFNTFESMTLTGRGDPTTGASLSNAPWTGSGPAGGYGVLTYLWSSYGVQVAFGYNSNRVYIRPRYYSSGNVWATSWDSFALSSDLGSYVKKSGDTMTGALTISYAASATMTYASTNPQIVFAESGSQPVKLIYTNYDSYRAPAGLKVIGSESGAWFEVHGNCYAAHFYENSDIKLKTNIEAITSSSNIPQLKSFDWKSDGSHSYGLIALELEEMGYSELVDSSGEHKTVKYSAALSLIVGKLQVKIRELEKEIENLKNKN